MTILIDTREPWPHPWSLHFSNENAAIKLERAGLETGDIAAAANPSVVVERKTVSDFMGSITAGRERFENELRRSRKLDFFCVVVEGSMFDCLAERGGMTMDSLLGTVAAITRRWCPVIFADSEKTAARLALKILSQPFSEANRLVAAGERADKKAAKAGKALAAGTVKVKPVNPDGTGLY